MSKGNPLFVDSTKLTTDTLAARLELKGKSLEGDQDLYLKVIDSSDFEHSQKMQLTADNLYQCQIWLNHQQEVQLQFFVLSPKGVIESSCVYKDRVSYMMEYQWQAAKEDEIINLYKKVDSNKVRSQPEESEKVFGEVEEMSALIDKWGL